MSATGRKPGEGKRIAASSTLVPAGETEPEAAPRDSTAETLKRRLHRLALDVHDGPMQNLAVIGFSLGDLRRRVQSVVPVEHQDKIDPAMEQISEELVRVEAELRALIGALEHGAIRTIPLIEAIETEIAEFERRSPAKVDRQIDPDVRTETDSQRIALQSVTREALSNIAKHAAAHNVTVRLRGTSAHASPSRSSTTAAASRPRRRRTSRAASASAACASAWSCSAASSRSPAAPVGRHVSPPH